MARPMTNPNIAPVSAPSSYATASTRNQADVGRDAVDLQVREQRGLQHHAHEHDEAEADAADHGIGAGGYLSTFTTVERVEVDDRAQLGVARDRAARADLVHDGADRPGSPGTARRAHPA